VNFRISFWWGVSIEMGLLLVAAGLAWALAVPLWGGWHWSWLDFGWGVAGAVPMLITFRWLMRLEWPALRRIREFLERVICSALGEWSVARMLAISVLAGVAEEVLFRAVLQGGLERGVGAAPALVLAGAVFGICHWITPAYALIAGLMGCYLGGLWWWSGNLLTPVVAHAAYDFVALVWLLRVRREGANDD